MAQRRHGPLTRADLDTMPCGNPECRTPAAAHGLMYLHPRCHVGSPTISAYDSKSGVILVRCATCAAPVAAIYVGDGPMSPRVAEG